MSQVVERVFTIVVSGEPLDVVPEATIRAGVVTYQDGNRVGRVLDHAAQTADEVLVTVVDGDRNHHVAA